MDLSKINTGLIVFLSVLLFFYFIFAPTITYYTMLTLFLVWLITMIADMSITIHYKKLICHEKSVLLKLLSQRVGVYRAGVITVLIEICFVVFAPILLYQEFSLEFSCMIAWWITLLHIQAIPWNLHVAS